VGVPTYPNNERLPVVNEYMNLLRKNKPDSDPDFISMEGYIAAKVFCDIIRNTPEPVTRQGFIQTAERIKTFDQDGFIATYSPNSRTGSEDVYFTQICPGGYITPVDDFANAYEYQPTF